MRAFAAAVLVLATLAAGPARASEGTFALVIYGYQKGTSDTKVDRTAALKQNLYPVVTEIELNSSAFYLSVGTDWAGQLVFAALPEKWYVDPDRYAKDEATINLKFGTYLDEKAFASFGYGFDLDTRTHTYSEVSGAAGDSKVRVGIGPNVAFRAGVQALWIAPNASVYYYPWPNEASSFIPKGKAGWGYRVEVPLFVDLSPVLGLGDLHIWLSAKPFYGWQGGFHRKDDATGETWNSEAKVSGVRFGLFFANVRLD